MGANEEFEWDEARRISNIEKHGFDFLDGIELFDNPHLTSIANTHKGEERWVAIGMIGNEYAAAIYTRRGRTVRLISLGSARRKERRRYDQVFKS